MEHCKQLEPMEQLEMCTRQSNLVLVLVLAPASDRRLEELGQQPKWRRKCTENDLNKCNTFKTLFCFLQSVFKAIVHNKSFQLLKIHRPKKQCDYECCELNLPTWTSLWVRWVQLLETTDESTGTAFAFISSFLGIRSPPTKKLDTLKD